MSLPTMNPFPDLINTLDLVGYPAANNQVYKDFMFSFLIITILSTLCLFVSLIARLRRGNFWIAKLENGWILLNYTSTWIIGSLLFMIVEIPYIQLSRTDYVTIGASLINQPLYRGLVWMPIILTAFSTAWVQALNSINVLSANGSASGLRSIAKHPKIGNSIFLLIYSSFIIGNVISSRLANNHWNETFELSIELRQALENASRDFNIGSIPNVFGLVALNLAVEAEANLTIYYIRLNYGVLALGLLVSMLSSCSSYYYFRHLKRSIRQAQSGSNQLKVLRRAYTTLLLVTGTSFFIQIIYTILLLYIIIHLDSIRFDPLANNIIFSISVAVYAIIGLIINLSILYQTFQFTPVVKSTTPILITVSNSGITKLDSLGSGIELHDKNSKDLFEV